MILELKNRRSSIDVGVVLTRILALSGWVLFIFAIGMSYYAAPEQDYGLLRFKGIEIRQFWLTPLTGYLYIVLWVSALCSYFCLVLDHYRSRRKRDSKHFNLILLLTVTIAWVMYILVQLNELQV
jgi:predicted nucleic acid-binding Zn ribbon protein